MGKIEEKIIEAGFTLPSLPAVAGLYSPAVRTGNLVFTSGQLPLCYGKLIEPGGSGKVNDTTIKEAANASRVALLNGLAAVQSLTGSLSAIERIIKLTVFVASEPHFSSQHIVANGASSLLHELFGNIGFHSRSAIGVLSLPLNASVEIELIVQCK